MATSRELEHAYKIRQLQVVSSMWRGFITLGCVVAVCGCIVLCVRQLAGKQTAADIGFKAVADLKANRWIALGLSWLLTGGTTGWAVLERRLRKRHIRRVSSESSELQAIIDPKRRSSNLSIRGETSPGDV